MTDQQSGALRAANAVRSARRELRERVKAREISMCDVLADPPDCITKMAVIDLLQWVPRIGRIRARAVLRGSRPPIELQAELFRLSVERRMDLAKAIELPGALG